KSVRKSTPNVGRKNTAHETIAGTRLWRKRSPKCNIEMMSTSASQNKQQKSILDRLDCTLCKTRILAMAMQKWVPYRLGPLTT
ncbi:hypothetical protein KI387_010330, partial [Taxus chinensis]